ncbi:MAG: hypothetical protein R3E39_10890 [Anaerolineae bacterium]
MAETTQLPLHLQTGTRELTAAKTQLAGGSEGVWRCNDTSAAVGSLMAAASSEVQC